MRTGTVMRWILLVALILVMCLTVNLTLYNWWLAGGPPTADPHVHERRGNIFAAVTSILLGSVLVVGFSYFKRWRRNSNVNRRSR
jgi:hypothetical protein